MKYPITQDYETIDYKKLGLKSGLEIHQQLNTKKLFCNCPSEIREDEPHFTVIRKLRASAGESGEIDQAALHEKLKQKSFHYQGYNDTTCLVELDEEPPHPINQESLKVGLQVGKMMNVNFVPKAQVMRKTVIDGSNTSGFQRTVLLGMGGFIEGDFGKAGIQTICIEEDAAKIIKRTPEYDIYNLSKLGIPLIEIATDPDLKTPENIRDAALHIGNILRATRKVRRGIGTIRQDVNISIKEGSRVELKGVQEIRLVPEIVKKEVARQAALVELKKVFEKNNIKFQKGNIINLTKEFRELNIEKGFLKNAIQKNDVIAFSLPGLKGLFGTELFKGYRVGTEISGYAKSVGFGGLIHVDEQESKYNLPLGTFDMVLNKLGLTKEDGFILLVGNANKATAAIEQVLVPRIEQLWKGVPSEVRKDNPDATTVYMRPMPGAARMYPETDIPNIVIDLKNIKIPKMLSEQIKDFAKKYGINEALAKEAIEEPLFEELANKYSKIKTQLIAEVIINYPKEILKREKKSANLSLLLEILDSFSKGKIPKDAIYELMVDAAHGRKIDYSKFEMLSEEEVSKILDKIIKENNLPINGLMGVAMKQLRGKADGKLIMSLLQKKIS